MRKIVQTALAVSAAFVLVGCVEPAPQAVSKPAPSYSVSRAEARLLPVQRRVEPVAERYCRDRLPAGSNCDFNIRVDPRADAPANAYQSLDRAGRPQIVFTAALIAGARNDDELGFVMSHEAAHHIEGHLGRKQRDTVTGAVVVGVLATLAGASAETVDSALDIGATVGSRAYSKDYEIEADRMGTVIAHQAGYDPVRGAEYFRRIPDPGNAFLGTHPPNALRIDVVRETAAGL
ncbi:M48 family metalloprotease [Shimia sp. FJ5]|uniref:M48 family metalloprotease n=1 Tax=Shimia sp. FJ5 TaxID=3079054 RepID=UPI003980D8C8